MMFNPLTGPKVFAMFAIGFGIIITVNLTLAFQAVATFPGLETRNSYVASQSFDRDKRAQDALGWTVSARLVGTGLVVRILGQDGQPVRSAQVAGTFGRATHVADDQSLTFAASDEGFRAPVEVAPGNWNLRLVAHAEDGTLFRRRIVLREMVTK
ncbi:MAG: nitrogen fixation protein FixH [Paracoccaceae bacterium]|jgi:nitrogen fixation protein FixH